MNFYLLILILNIHKILVYLRWTKKTFLLYANFYPQRPTKIRTIKGFENTYDAELFQYWSTSNGKFAAEGVPQFSLLKRNNKFYSKCLVFPSCLICIWYCIVPDMCNNVTWRQNAMNSWRDDYAGDEAWY